MCDNCKNPKEKVEVQRRNCGTWYNPCLDLNENYLMKTMMDFIMGRETKEMKDFGFTEWKTLGSAKTGTKISGVPFSATP
jgi:ATP-dependent DNA helicase RecQ